LGCSDHFGRRGSRPGREPSVSPEWVGAVGQWAGAAGTIAAIIWAVHTFQQESRHRQEDLGRETADKRKAEFDLAEAVQVCCSGGSADGLEGGPTWLLNSVWIWLMNGTREPVTIGGFDYSVVWYDELLPASQYRAVLPGAPELVGGVIAPERIAASIDWAVRSAKDADPAEKLAGSVDRMAHDASRHVVQHNAVREGVKYLRHAAPGACAWGRLWGDTRARV